MKRILTFILSALVLLSCVSCAAEIKVPEEDSAPKESATATEESKKPATPSTTVKPVEKPVQYPKVVEPLTPEKLAEIPIANDSMTTDELRQICLDYFKLQLTFSWTPDSIFKYTIESSGKPAELSVGIVYGGIPYVTIGTGNLYRILETYNTETGVMNVSDYQKQPKLFGNQCSVGAFWGWGRVINSANYTWTPTMVQKNGFIPVGSYTYDPELKNFTAENGTPTQQITKANGEQTMYASYALLQPADGIVHYSGTAGHVRMISSVATVVYDANGQIDGEKSTICYRDQDSSWTTGKQSDGSRQMFQGGVDKKTTFKKLYDKGYLPFTFAELIGTDPVEKATASCSLGESGNITVAQLKSAKTTANYAISDTFAVILDENGNEVDRFVERATKASDFEMDFESTIYSTVVSKYADGKHKVEISVQLSTGEKLTVFNGTLVP